LTRSRIEETDSQNVETQEQPVRNKGNGRTTDLNIVRGLREMAQFVELQPKNGHQLQQEGTKVYVASEGFGMPSNSFV